MVDALDAVLGRAADADVPDLDAAQRAVHAAVSTQPAAAHRPVSQPMSTSMSAPMSMQDRILGTLTDIAQRAGWQVSIQPQYADTGRVYITAVNTFAVQVELAYHFDTDSCGLHFHGPAIEALDLHDSPPQYRYQRAWRGRVLSYHALRYADGDGITAMLDLLTRALVPATAALAPDVDRPSRRSANIAPPPTVRWLPLRAAGDLCRPHEPSIDVRRLAGRGVPMSRKDTLQ